MNKVIASGRYGPFVAMSSRHLARMLSLLLSCLVLSSIYQLSIQAFATSANIHGKEEEEKKTAMSIDVIWPNAESPVTLNVYHEENVRETVRKFCEDYDLIDEQCHELTNRAEERLMMEYGTIRYRIFNDHDRIGTAYFNEVNFQPYNATEVDEEMNKAMMMEFGEMDSDKIAKIAIIHSCSFPEQKIDILGSMLDRMHFSGLMKTLDVVFIMQYGKEYTNSTYLGDAFYGHVKYIYADTSCENFEIPTFQSMVSFIKNENLHKDSHILYMHTKGASYIDIPRAVNDWRDYMLYFVVDLHEKCSHLLLSGEFDVVGTNIRKSYIKENSGLMMMGNFFWTTVDYMRSLPPLIVNSKYSAELFILSSGNTRVHVLHDAHFDVGEVEIERRHYDISVREARSHHCVTANMCVKNV